MTWLGLGLGLGLGSGLGLDVEQSDPAALEPRAQLADARAGVRASAVLVDAAERAAQSKHVRK